MKTTASTYRVYCKQVGFYGPKYATKAEALAAISDPQLIAPETYFVAEFRGKGVRKRWFNRNGKEVMGFVGARSR